MRQYAFPSRSPRYTALHFDLEYHLPEAVGCQRGHHTHQLGHREIRAEPEQAGIERHQFLLGASGAPKQYPGKPGQAVDFDQNFWKLGVAEGSRERLAHRIEASILRPRLAAGQPQFVAIDRDRTGLDGFGQCGKPGRQARFQPLKIFLRTGRQVEVADEPPLVALPERQGDQLVLRNPMGQAVIDRNGPVAKRPLQGHQGRRVKAAEGRAAIRLVDQILPRGTKGLRGFGRQSIGRDGE